MNSPSAPAPRATPWLAGLVLVLALAVLVPFVGHCALYLSFPFSLDDTEGYNLGQLQRLSTGGRLYGPINEWPYVVDNYPPGFPVLMNALEGGLGRQYQQRALLPVAGVGEEDERSVGVKAATLAHNLPLLRGVIALVIVGMLSLMALDWRRHGVPMVGVGVALVCFLAQPPVFFMTPLLRADWWALLCGVAALVLGHRALQDPEDRRYLIGATVIGCLALLFRQSAIVPLASLGLTLLLAKDRRFGLFLGIAVGLGLVIGIALHLTYGAGIWSHLTTYTKTRWLFDRLLGTWGFVFRHSALFLLLSVLAWTSVKREQGWSLPVVYAPLALATAVLSGKIGSDMNYFLEPFLACTWVLGYGCRTWMQGTTVMPSWALIGVAAVLLQSGIVQNPREGSYRPTRWDLANGIEFITQLQTVDAPVLSEEEGMLALAGKPVWYNPFIMAELGREGLWDDSPVVEMIRAQQLPIVITLEVPNPQVSIDRGRGAGWDRWTPAMLNALATAYRPAVVLPVRREWIVLVPRKATSGQPLQSTPND